MPFFLLSRDDNDDLRLLTSAALPTRQDALAELSRLTAEPSFDAWDADVVLVDLDSATPVLLVRPAEAGAGSETDLVVVEEPDQEVSESVDEVESLLEDAYVAEADDVSEVLAEPQTAIPTVEAEAFASYVSPSAGADPTPAVLADVEAASEETELPVPEMAMELEPESEPASEAEPDVEVEAEGDELRDALERTTAAMEQDALAGESAETPPAEAPQAEVITEKWPWDTSPASEPEQVEVSSAVGTDDDLAAQVPDVVEVEVAETKDSDKVSEFLEDLEPIPPSVGSESEAAPLAADSAASDTVDGYVCADCVYVGTCPNKDERLPRDCGSFQWK